MNKLFEYQPDYAVHPGETLREALEERNLSPKEFAIRTGKPIKTISNLINGKTSITPDMAVQFEKVLRIPANFWLKLQAEYDEFLARAREKNNLKTAAEWAKKFPYGSMAKLGWVKSTRKESEKVSELFAFFRISKVKSWEDIYFNEALPVFFRVSLKHEKDPYALSAWLAKGEQIAKSVNSSAFSKIKLKENLSELKNVMVKEPKDFFKKIQEICLTSGVKVIYTPSLPKIHINGVVRWIDNNPIIQIYDRYKRYDIFWFSFFHELGHILLHGNKKNIFFENLNNLNLENDYEKEANKFASNLLLTDEQFEIVLKELERNQEPLKVIRENARKFGTHPDIIIGRLLYRNTKLYKSGIMQKSLTKINISEQPKLF